MISPSLALEKHIVVFFFYLFTYFVLDCTILEYTKGLDGEGEKQKVN